MKLDFKEIIGAWYSKINHTPEQKELADNRFAICITCPHKQEILNGKEWSLKCGQCGCPLSAKVYTKKTHLDKNGSCPLHKWKDVEIEHFIKYGYITNSKNNKTML
jgi:hypothetical protein